MNITRKKLMRCGYWLVVLLVMLFVVLPTFIFFYTFDERQAKQLILAQFDNHNYHIDITGKIYPFLWHGFSINVNNIKISSLQDIPLVDIHDVKFQLSWLDLMFNRYYIKRIIISGVIFDIDKIKLHKLYNLFNLSNQYKEKFKQLISISVNQIDVLSKAHKVSAYKGGMQLHKSGDQYVADMSFDLYLSKAHYVSHVNLHGVVNVVEQNITNAIKFSHFTTNVSSKYFDAHIMSDAVLDLNKVQFILNNSTGKINIDTDDNSINSSYNEWIMKAQHSTVDLNGIELMNVVFNSHNEHSNESYILDNVLPDDLFISTSQMIMQQAGRLYSQQAHLSYQYDLYKSKVNIDSNITGLSINDRNINTDSCINHINVLLPSDRNMRATLSGICSYNIAQHILNLILVGNLDEKPLQVKLKVYTGRKKPRINVSGSIDSLDLSRIPLSAEKTLPIYYDTSELPFAWISLYDVDANLAIKHLVLDRITLDNMLAKFVVNSNVLNITQLYANIYDGSLSAQLKIAKTKDFYDIDTRQKIGKVDLRNLFGDIFDVHAISGMANLNIDASIKNARTYFDIRKINGEVSVHGERGQIEGIDFNMSSMDDRVWTLNQNQSTIFDTLNANFSFVDGISKGQITLSSPFASLKGGGTINFMNTTMDYNLFVNSKLPNNKDKINYVVIPLHVAGSLFNPKISIQNIHLLHNNLHNRSILRRK